MTPIPSVKLSIAIQHNKFAPSRAKMCSDLFLNLNDPRVSVPRYNEENLWGSCRNALLSHPADSTHHLILQDDILPCRDFLFAVEEIIKILPNDPVTFFSNSQAVVIAMKSGERFAKLRTWFMAQAYVMPVGLIHEMVEWIDEKVRPDVLMDDDRMATYMFYHDRFVYATAPSLVEHIGWNETTLRTYKDDFFKKERKRKASAFIGADRSASDIDWWRGIGSPVIDNEGSNSMFCSNLR